MEAEGLSFVAVGCYLIISMTTWARGQRIIQLTVLITTETTSQKTVNGLHHRSKIEIDGLTCAIKQELLVLVGRAEHGSHTYGLTESRNTYTREMISLRLVADEDMRKIIMVIL